jgi:formamidopyrimidine-DNA glycosylase
LPKTRAAIAASVARASPAPSAFRPCRTPNLPELPDIDLYIERLGERIRGQTLQHIRIGNPFFVRSFEPPLNSAENKKVESLRRIGKRIAIGLEGDLWLLIHLMVAGRLQWREEPVTLKGKQQLAAFEFPGGTLLVTEAGTKKRASLYLLDGEDSLEAHNPGGLEPLCCQLDEFSDRLNRGNHTLKRALTDPRLFSGIGNAYSDEILHAAKLSPIRLTHKLDAEERQKLFEATQTVLNDWSQRLKLESPDEFPKKVTAFKEGMAVHGKFGEPCPDCGKKVQRIRYKSNETNYCAKCQTGGKILADRSLSRLLKKDWPNSIDEL